MVRKILQPFYILYVIITFFLSAIIVILVILLFATRSNFKTRRYVCLIIKKWSALWLWLIGMPVKKIGTSTADGRYVIVANHVSYLDSILLFATIPGYFRPLGKKEFSKIPLVGFVYRKVVIMVDRSSTKSRAKSMRLLWRALKHEGSVAIFPEGTFNETGASLKEFYDGAFRLAINSQSAILPIIFPDTIHRWHYSAWWKLWPGENRAVYLEPVSTQGMLPENLTALKKQVYILMETALANTRQPV